MTKPEKKNKEAQWFGYKKVNPTEKSGLVQGVFDSVAKNYDLMNDVMSGGVHRVWKNTLIRLMRPRPDKKLLDVAGGTGDIAFKYLKKAGTCAEITVCDINQNMLDVGRDRAFDRGIVKGIDWVHGDAQKLPFEDETFDLYSISFGLRNVPKIDDALKEAHRVLKPGGYFYCLEFSEVQVPVLNKLYDLYSFTLLPKMGKYIAKDEESYKYLAESIRQFPKQAELEQRMYDAGFKDAHYINLSGGIAAIHIGLKI